MPEGDLLCVTRTSVSLWSDTDRLGTLSQDEPVILLSHDSISSKVLTRLGVGWVLSRALKRR